MWVGGTAMSRRKFLVAKALPRRPMSAFVATLLAAASLTSMASRGVASEGAATTSGETVCGTAQPDATFTKEVRLLGAEHACEHLKDRRFVETKADREAMKSAYASAVADLATTDPAVIGSWSEAKNPGTKTIGITSVLLHTGKVLIFGGKLKATDKNTASYLFDPVTGTGHEVPAPAAIFCGSAVQLGDGRVLSVGGTNKIPRGIVDVWLFDPNTEKWTRQPDTPLGRYYPTSTKLADGTVVVTAGTELDGVTANPTVELFTPPQPGTDVGTLKVVGPNHVTGYYPRQWLMPDGNMLQVEGRKSYRLDTQTWQWQNLLGLPVGNGAGSAGLMLPGDTNGSTRVMMIGGLKGGQAVTSTEMYDYSNPAAGWAYGRPMLTPRTHMNVVQVPDGSAYGIGGNSSGLYNVGQFQTMKYDPSTDTWTNMAVQTPRRAYHSTAVLLPDGRIMSAGDTGAGGGKQLIDFYSPPYLFHGPRPTITDAPSQVSYGGTFPITLAGAPATRAVLMAPGATTHADEMNARHVELAVTRTSGGFVATGPTPRVAPPGYYMLFALTADGVPSMASWVHVGA
jgi:N-acetylneuraminic acid mutarotase